MSEGEFDSVQKRLIGWLLVAVIGANSSILALNKFGTPDLRSDPFTGSDAEELEAELKAYVTQEFVNMRLTIPPIATKRRIYAIERWMEKQHPDFQPPTHEW